MLVYVSSSFRGTYVNSSAGNKTKTVILLFLVRESQVKVHIIVVQYSNAATFSLFFVFLYLFN